MPKETAEDVREKILTAIRNVQFRCHGKDDVDFHSGCVQTRDSIMDAVQKLPLDPPAEDKVCPRCEGRKAISIPAGYQEEKPEWKHPPCPDCHGTGRERKDKV